MPSEHDIPGRTEPGVGPGVDEELVFLTSHEAAQILRVTPETVCGYCQRRRLNCHQPGGRRARWLIPLRAIRRFLAGPGSPEARRDGVDRRSAGFGRSRSDRRRKKRST
jgi:hypothetical protein